MFFCKDKEGRLIKLPINATEDDILTDDRATIDLDSNKNGWEGVSLFQEHNGYEEFIPV